MSKFERLVPQHVRALGGYVPGKSIHQAEKESGVRCIKMASNENPFGPSPQAVEAMRRAVEEANLYPDNEVSGLRQRLATLHGIGRENILVTAGTTSFLITLGRTLLASGLNAITSERSFIIYPIATEGPGGRLIRVAMRTDRFDLDAIMAAINPDTRIVFIANPNNPTGTLLTPAELDRFMSKVPEHVCVVLDEAYCDFAEYFARQRGAEYTHSLQYVREGRNVVVLRTFSKAHGLAGARIGYGIAPAEQIAYCARLKTVFSVTAIAEAGAMAAMQDEQHIRRTLENNAAGVEYLSKKIGEMGFRVVPTWANFVYAEVGEDAAAVGKRMQDEGVIIRPLGGGWGAPQAIRITVGTPEQNRRCVAVMRKVLEKVVVGSH
ncbi:MAG: histidinol-phosphate transaminase [Acidobacteriia bacterium]|nr:histidinol-phosphate transaminase [Terriglobia bacterium]